MHGFYGKVFSDTDISVTNVIYIQVGEQSTYAGSPFIIPGIVESGHYDSFQNVMHKMYLILIILSKI